jgi:starch phosphorylase
LKKVFAAIQGGKFGDAGPFSALIGGITEHGDFYLVSDDFQSYLETHDLIDASYKNQDEWVSKCITSVARMGFFSSDRCIQDYADSIWNIEPLAVKSDGLGRGKSKKPRGCEKSLNEARKIERGVPT